MTPIKIQEVAYHRNGVCGEGFHAVKFRYDYENFVATVFAGEGRCAVLSLDRDNVTVGDNSWRGDVFEPQLRKAIKAYDRKLAAAARR